MGDKTAGGSGLGVRGIIRLEADHTKEQWCWNAYYQGHLAAVLTATPHGNDVLIHNRVIYWSRDLLSEYIRCFATVRHELRALGMKLVITCSDNYTDKMGRYWRLMGFRFFGDVPISGKHIPYAVMEV